MPRWVKPTPITFDLAIYSKAKEIQWRFPNEFSNLVVRMGGFHIVLNFLSLIGKKFADSGLDNLLIESGVYAAGSTSALMKGKSYNRGIRAHKLCLEVLFRLMWDAFILWYESRDEKIPEEPVLHKIVDCVRAVESDKESARESLRKITTDLTEITDLFAIFKSENQERSKLFAFWDEYCSMVTTLLQFLRQREPEIRSCIFPVLQQCYLNFLSWTGRTMLATYLFIPPICTNWN